MARNNDELLLVEHAECLSSTCTARRASRRVAQSSSAVSRFRGAEQAQSALHIEDANSIRNGSDACPGAMKIMRSDWSVAFALGWEMVRSAASTRDSLIEGAR